jgi:hypothetical protein
MRGLNYFCSGLLPSLSPFLRLSYNLCCSIHLGCPTAFVMPSIRFLASLLDEDGLYAVLEKMEAADAASITILRKRSQHEPLRNIISGLWFAILY